MKPPKNRSLMQKERQSKGGELVQNTAADELLDNDQVKLQLKPPWIDGTTYLLLSYWDLIEKHVAPHASNQNSFRPLK